MDFDVNTSSKSAGRCSFLLQYALFDRGKNGTPRTLVLLRSLQKVQTAVEFVVHRLCATYETHVQFLVGWLSLFSSSSRYLMPDSGVENWARRDGNKGKERAAVVRGDQPDRRS